MFAYNVEHASEFPSLLYDVVCFLYSMLFCGLAVGFSLSKYI